MGEKSDSDGRINLVSSQSDSDLIRSQEIDNVSYHLNVMAANLIRVVRGAGKPFQLPGDCADFLDSMSRFLDKCGSLPSPGELQQMLDVEHKFDSKLSNEQIERQEAESKVVRGALQITASRLAGQSAQEHMGNQEMFDGLKELEYIRKRNRASRE